MELRNSFCLASALGRTMESFAALEDERIVGLALLDGCGYRTTRFHLHRLTRHYLPRMFRLEKWKRLLYGGNAENTTESMQMGIDIREYPERQVAEEQIMATG